MHGITAVAWSRDRGENAGAVGQRTFRASSGPQLSPDPPWAASARFGRQRAPIVTLVTRRYMQ